jgi:hypothetical protein
MNFLTDKIRGCKQCQMALSDTNATGFCTTWCENEYNGKPNKNVPEKKYYVERVRVRNRKPAPAKLTEMQKHWNKVNQQP